MKGSFPYYAVNDTYGAAATSVNTLAVVTMLMRIARPVSSVDLSDPLYSMPACPALSHGMDLARAGSGDHSLREDGSIISQYCIRIYHVGSRPT